MSVYLCSSLSHSIRVPDWKVTLLRYINAKYEMAISPMHLGSLHQSTLPMGCCNDSQISRSSDRHSFYIWCMPCEPMIVLPYLGVIDTLLRYLSMVETAVTDPIMVDGCCASLSRSHDWCHSSFQETPRHHAKDTSSAQFPRISSK